MKHFLFSCLFVAAAASAAAQEPFAVSANDGKAVLENGVSTVPAAPLSDGISVIATGSPRPRIVGEIRVPTSVIGPPESVAISPDGRFAVVTASTRLDPADARKTISADIVSLVDLKAKKVVQTLHAGLGAAGVSFDPAGARVLVAGRDDGTLSVFAFAHGRLVPAGRLAFGPHSAPSLPVFAPDGKRVLLTLENESAVAVLAADGAGIADTGERIHTGPSPYSIVVDRTGAFAVAADMTPGGRDGGMLSLIDLAATPYVAFTASTAPSPEGLALSADGRFVASSSLNGSNFPPGKAGFHDSGLLQVFRRDGMTLRLVAAAPSGHWCEGLAWGAGGRTLLLQCMVEKEIQVFSFDGEHLSRTGSLAIPAGPAGLRAWP